MAEPDDQLERREDEEGPPVAPPSRGADQAVWVGFFLVVGIIAIFAALFILTDAAFFRGRYIVSTVVTDAGGIRRGDPVQMRGVNIGRVQRFKIAKDNVEIRLDSSPEACSGARSRRSSPATPRSTSATATTSTGAWCPACSTRPTAWPVRSKR